MSSPLEIFRSDEAIINDATFSDADVLRAFNFWEGQEQSCPVSIAKSSSPCYTDACQKYKTTAQRTTCRNDANSYCANVCPDVSDEKT